MNIFKQFIHTYKQKSVKKYWENKTNPCMNAERIFSAAHKANISLNKVLEFGCSWGGNLKYFMDKIPSLGAVGVDINRDCLKLAKDYPNFKGVVGDEKMLEGFGENEFDLAFTVSVLDHIPFDYTVEAAIGQLLRISRYVILLEPYLEGVAGDVSGKERDLVKPGLVRGYKKFAPYSYFWNYDAILDANHVVWDKEPMPLHEASLGPFYHLYTIKGDKEK